MDTQRLKNCPDYRDGYSAAVMDAAQVIMCLPFDKEYLELTGDLSETDYQALAWRIGQKVVELSHGLSKEHENGR